MKHRLAVSKIGLEEALASDLMKIINLNSESLTSQDTGHLRFTFGTFEYCSCMVELTFTHNLKSL